MTTSKTLGRSEVLDKRKVAPVREMFLAVHSNFGDLLDRTMNVDRRTLFSGFDCRSPIMVQSPDDKLSNFFCERRLMSDT